MKWSSYDYLYHHGILGMRWGKRNGPPYPLGASDHSASEKKAGWRKSLNGYKPNSLSARIAKRQNQKVDKGFQKWKEGASNRESAIELGKKANALKMESLKDRSKKKEARKAEKEYKKALSKNTTYRKGQVKNEVGKDISRKYLSEAKKVKKQLDKDPTNKKLQKQYNDLMSKHEVERAKARRAPEAAANRSRAKANIKRGMTIAVKTFATTALVTGGVYFVNKQLASHDVLRNDAPFRLDAGDVLEYINIGKNFLKFI